MIIITLFPYCYDDDNTFPYPPFTVMIIVYALSISWCNQHLLRSWWWSTAFWFMIMVNGETLQWRIYCCWGWHSIHWGNWVMHWGNWVVPLLGLTTTMCRGCDLDILQGNNKVPGEKGSKCERNLGMRIELVDVWLETFIPNSSLDTTHIAVVA